MFVSGAAFLLWLSHELPSEKDLRSHLWARHVPAAQFTWVPLWAISPKLQSAVVIWEDPLFYHHSGFNYAEIWSALKQDLRAGAYKRGGSTITQQVAKNLFLGPRKSLVRKLREAILARRLERALSKDEILEIYLNIAEWGDGVQGAEAASRRYFQKSAADLTWGEAALLAGILPNPLRWNPHIAPSQSARVQRKVLMKLCLNGDIEVEELRHTLANVGPGNLR